MPNRFERSRYAQVALSYTLPWPLRVWAIAAALLALWMLLAPGGAEAEIAMLVFGGTIAVWVGAMITAHAKEQLADARSSLTPGFRAPHLLVAAALFVVTVCGVTLLVGWRTSPVQWQYGSYDVWLPGYLALVLVVTAALAWIGHLQSAAGVLVLVPLTTPAWFAGGRAMLNDIIRGRSDELGYAILAAAVVALAALWARMARLHAEMPEYARTAAPGLRLRVRTTGDPAFRRESAAGAGPIEAWVRRSDRLDDVANVADAGFWRRARHWRTVVGLGRMPVVVALVLGAWTFILPTLTSGARDPYAQTVLPVILSTLVPGLVVAGVWPRRWYALADESLRPASRRQFVREQGAAMATELASVWLAITVATFAGSILPRPTQVLSSPLWRALPALAAGQVLVFGVVVWVLRYRAGWLVVVTMLLAMTAALVVLLIGGALAQRPDIRPLLAASATFAVIGLAITFDAYRRWLVTEFD